ncbi:MAG: hypothetical protein WBX25_06125, partial [Rhodomicrobium sp.]
MISRRLALLGFGAIAAPFVIRTPGILMPIRNPAFHDFSEATICDPLRMPWKDWRRMQDIRARAVHLEWPRICPERRLRTSIILCNIFGRCAFEDCFLVGAGVGSEHSLRRV